jgi:Leucine-rich repeat (LRR) protein
MNRIGIRTLASSMNIVSISVYRLALPEKASPLIAGDSLVEGMHFKEAISKYVTIAENYGITQVTEQALAKAYVTAATKLTTDRDKILNDIREQIRTKFPKFRYLEMTLEVDAIVHWREKNYRESLNMVAKIFKINPNTNVVLRLLECQHSPLTPDISEELLTWISKTKNIKRLNLSNLGLESLDPIKDLPLTFLDCSNNQLTALDALKDMELETFSCSNNQIASLKPLREMPLRDLNCSNNQIKNLDPLRKMPIKHLDCSYNKIEDLEPLKDMTIERLNCRNNNIKKLDILTWMPLKDLNFASNFIEDLNALKDMKLEKLVCANNKFTSLGPLRTMKLEQLDCSYNKISDISPLEGMRLEYLDCSFTNVKDLQPIKNMPLKTLMIFECLDIEDISVLSKIDTLEKIGLPSNVKDIETLKALPLLKQIQYYNSDKVIEVNHSGVKNEKNIP